MNVERKEVIGFESELYWSMRSIAHIFIWRLFSREIYVKPRITWVVNFRRLEHGHARNGKRLRMHSCVNRFSAPVFVAGICSRRRGFSTGLYLVTTVETVPFCMIYKKLCLAREVLCMQIVLCERIFIICVLLSTRNDQSLQSKNMPFSHTQTS